MYGMLTMTYQMNEIMQAVHSTPFFDPDAKDENKNKSTERSNKKAGEILIDCTTSWETWRCPLGKSFVSFEANGHIEHHGVRDNTTALKLQLEYYKSTGTAAKKSNIDECLDNLEAKALFENRVYRTAIRVAEWEGSIYHDLGNDKWEAIKITADGYNLVDSKELSQTGFRFLRKQAMLPLPYPQEASTNLQELFAICGIQDQANQILLSGILIQGINPNGPYPICVIRGTQGTGKSTLSRMIRRIIDPNQAEIRSLPNEEDHFGIQCENSHFSVFDNVSTQDLPRWFYDTCCRLATGAGASKRALYKNNDEVIRNICRPLLINGIDDMVARGDFLERAVIIELKPIDPGRRKTQREIEEAFGEAHPRLLGALYHLTSSALANRNKVRLKELPRMADFCQWITACEDALQWEPGTFARTLKANSLDMNDLALESSSLGSAIRKALPLGIESTKDADLEYKSANEILKVLSRYNEDPNDRTFPKTGAALSRQLKRLVPLLNHEGYEVEFHRKETNLRPLSIRRMKTE